MTSLVLTVGLIPSSKFINHFPSNDRANKCEKWLRTLLVSVTLIRSAQGKLQGSKFITVIHAELLHHNSNINYNLLVLITQQQHNNLFYERSIQ